MEYKTLKLSNTDINYDDVVYSPHQLKCFAEVSGLYEQYYYFIYSRQKVLLFRLERVGGFTKAVCEYPNNDTALLQAFLHFCKKKHYIYSIAVDIKLLPLPYFSSSYKIEVDVEEFVLHQKLRYEVNKARKSGVSVKRLDDAEELYNFSNLHFNTVNKSDSHYSSTLSQLVPYYKKYFNKNIFYFGAYLEERLIGGVILLANKRSLLYLHNATDLESYKINPTYILLDEIIAWARSKGYRDINMNIGLGAYLNKAGTKKYNIERFKKKWGYEKTLYVYEPWYWIMLKRGVSFGYYIKQLFYGLK